MSATASASRGLRQTLAVGLFLSRDAATTPRFSFPRAGLASIVSHMEPIAVAAGITATRHLISICKSLTDAVKASGKTEAVNNLIELQSVVLDLMQKHQEQILSNVELRERIKDLEADLAQSQNLIFAEELYWRTKEGADREGPFCPICFDKDKKVIRLHDGRKRAVQTRWICMVCESDWDS